jgi:hypothetical protein
VCFVEGCHQILGIISHREVSEGDIRGLNTIYGPDSVLPESAFDSLEDVATFGDKAKSIITGRSLNYVVRKRQAREAATAAAAATTDISATPRRKTSSSRHFFVNLCSCLLKVKLNAVAIGLHLCPQHAFSAKQK